MIHDKCKGWKVADAPLLSYWCEFVCGNTGGRLCEPWCRIVERHGLWTLLVTIGLPAGLVLLLVLRML